MSKKIVPQIIHVGRTPPKGYREVGSSMHVGRGLYLMRCEPIQAEDAAPTPAKPRRRKGGAS